jgi:hypothetical protein
MKYWLLSIVIPVVIYFGIKYLKYYKEKFSKEKLVRLEKLLENDY